MDRKSIDKNISKLSKMSPVKIKNEFIQLNNSNIPPHLRRYIKNKTFSQMPIQKRRKIMNLFGQAAVTQAAVTQPAVTQAAVTQAAVTQPAATQAAVTQAAATQAAATMAQIAPRTMAMLSSPTVTTGSYTAAAGALQGAEQALIAAGQQLAAAQGLTGFGKTIKPSYGTLYDMH